MSAAAKSKPRRLWRAVWIELWTYAPFKRLTPDEQRLVFLLLTGPMTNRCGLFRFDVGDAAALLALTPAAVLAALVNVCRSMGWRHDGTAGVVWIPMWLALNPLKHHRHVEGALRDLQHVPDTPLIELFIERGVSHLPTDASPENFANLARQYLGNADATEDDNPFDLANGDTDEPAVELQSELQSESQVELQSELQSECPVELPRANSLNSLNSLRTLYNTDRGPRPLVGASVDENGQGQAVTEKPRTTKARRRPFTAPDVYLCDCGQTVERHDGHVFDYRDGKHTTAHACPTRHAHA